MSKKKHKRKHKMCAGSGCHNIVAKDSKKGALCSVCGEKLGTNILTPKKDETRKIETKVVAELSIAEKLAILRKKVEGNG